MRNSITLQNSRMPMMEYKGQRVVKFAMVDEAHQLNKKGEVRGLALWYQADQFSDVSAFLRRCLRLISPFTAVTMNCAFVSPDSRLFSNSVTTSCGNLALSCCDLLLTEPVAITGSPWDRCDSVYAKKITIKVLRCDSLKGSLKSEGAIHLASAKPGSARNTNRASDHNVNGDNAMAVPQCTQTHPKFTWRFLVLGLSTREILSVDASTEQEARELTPSGCVIIFMARTRLVEVNHARN